MNASDLRERIAIERMARIDDGSGGYTEQWATVASVAAQVLPTGGREVLTGGSMAGIQGWKVTIRHRPDLSPADRIRWRDKLLNVKSAADPDGKRAWTVAFAESGVAA